MIDGIRHNIPFLSALMQHERWKAGRLSTGFIAEEFPDGFAPLEAKGEIAHALACVAAAIDHAHNERKRLISGQLRAQRPVAFERARVAMLGKARYDLTLDDSDGVLMARFGDASAHAHRLESDWVPGDLVWRGTIDETEIAVQVRPILNGFHLSHAGVSVEARVYTQREAELAALMPEKIAADTSKTLLCPMPGLVKAILVKEGQEAKAGEALAIVEAMKMENVLRAERDVTVTAIRAKEGDSLPVDAVIMDFA